MLRTTSLVCFISYVPISTEVIQWTLQKKWTTSLSAFCTCRVNAAARHKRDTSVESSPLDKSIIRLDVIYLSQNTPIRQAILLLLSFTASTDPTTNNISFPCIPQSSSPLTYPKHTRREKLVCCRYYLHCRVFVVLSITCLAFELSCAIKNDVLWCFITSNLNNVDFHPCNNCLQSKGNFIVIL